MFLLLPTIHHSNAIVSAYGEENEEMVPITRGISLSGEVDIYDAADSMIIGKTFDGVGHRMGTYTHVGDYNGDGINDIAISSFRDFSIYGVPEDGRIYIYFGDGNGLTEFMDMDTTEPDHIIMGSAFNSSSEIVDVEKNTYVGNQIEYGDFNNDNITDLVVGVSNIRMGIVAGKFVRESVIIWGDHNGWPKNIVINMSKHYEANYNFTILSSGSNNRDDIPIYEGYGNALPRGAFGMDKEITTDFFIVEDIDKDGFDDIASGGFITDRNGTIPRVWTFSIYWGATGNKTSFFEEQDSSFMGKSLDLGDIDGDGWLDAVVGAPYMSKTYGSVDNYGAALIIFNISKLQISNEYRGKSLFCPMNETYDVMIWGSGTYDWFGNRIKLHDINNDGMDEIFIGAPYADGPADLNKNSGQIYMFKGGPQNKFTKMMDADNDADSIVFGDQGYVNGPPEIMADTLGNRFEIADIDNNGELEFIAGLPLKNLPDKDGRQRNKAGLVMVYTLNELFNDESSIVQISNSNGIFVLHGYDMEDSFGYQLLLEDVDSDGIKDIYLTAPMADGPNNLRPRCGEAYVIRGKGLVINDLELSGSAVEEKSVFLGGGKMEIDLPFRNTKGSDRINEGRIVIDPGRMDLEIIFDRDGYVLNYNLEMALINSDIRMEWTGSEEKGNVHIELEPGWDLVTNEWLDIHTEFVSGYNETITRMFERVVRLRSDVMISGKPDIYHDDAKVIHPGRWFTPGETFSIDVPQLVYKHDTKRPVNESPFIIEMYNGNELLDSIPYNGNRKLMTLVEPIPEFNISLVPKADDHDGAAWVFGKPGTGKAFERMIKIDYKDPDMIESTSLISKCQCVENYSVDGRFHLSWKDNIGTLGDNDESGVKYNEVSYSEKTVIPKRYGGLYATYYQDQHFLTPGMERIETAVDFLDWGLWSPEPSLIPPDHFSARFHGYIELKGDYDQFVRFIGVGNVKVFVDGEMALDWFDLRGSPKIGPYNSEDPIILPIEIYYKHSMGRAGIKMEHLDPSGAYVLMEEDMLQIPANYTDIDEDLNGPLDIKIMSVDWTGKRSKPTTATGNIDNIGPKLSFIDISSWYPDEDITIKVSIDDGDPSSSTGTNTSTVEYRLKRDGEDWLEWTSEDLWFLEQNEGPIDPFEIAIVPELSNYWKGIIQVKASDRLGNPSTSEIIWFGIDTTAPEIMPIDTKHEKEITANEVVISIGTKDIGGSGVDVTSIMMRTSVNDEPFSEWMTMKTEMDDTTYISKYIMMDLEGFIRYQFKASDLVGNEVASEVYWVNISRIKTDLPPIPKISYPIDGNTFQYGSLITFSAFGTTDDMIEDISKLKFTWVSSIDGIIGTGFEMTAILTDGEHIIRLYVDDGIPGNNVSSSINLTVNEEKIIPGKEDNDKDVSKGSGIDPLFIILPLLLLGLFAIIAAVLVKRKYETTETEQVQVQLEEPTLYRTYDIEE